MAELVAPCAQFFAGFVDAEVEYRRDGRRQLVNLDVLRTTPEALLSYYADMREGRNLAPSFVSATSLWLVDEDAYIGGVNVRHDLNEMLRQFGGHIGYMIRPSARRRGYGKLILKLAVPVARSLGIENALVTCDKTNVASRRIIESNGGVFENELEQGQGLPPKLRFWIDTRSAAERDG